MAALVNLVAGSDPDLQLEATWCVNNMAANTDQHALHAMEQAGASLIQNLQQDKPDLQVGAG